MSIPKTAVRIAVEPLLSQAEDAAAMAAVNIINETLADLAANNWDAQICAPWPHGIAYGSMDYHLAKTKHLRYNLLTEDGSTHRDYTPGAPNIRKRSQKEEARFIKEARENAALEYESFIQKLEKKIGSHSAAVLEGSHVWDYSILTVTTPEGTERWKTRMIINVSKLGKIFNQFPTRKVK